MAQTFKLFYFSIYLLLFLQLADSAPQNSPNKSDTTLNGQDGEKEKATFFKNIDNVVNSRPIKIVRQLSNSARERLNKFSNDFQTTLNEDSKNTVNGENSLIPNAIQNNLILPAKALAQTSFKTVKEPVGEMFSSIKKTYDDELVKSDQEEGYVPIIGAYTKSANKPVAIIRASKDIVENAIGSIFERASSLWHFGTTNTAEKSKKDK
ncbi:uncharacterized protein LOC113556825 [Rhopalosiphum maidis]|uniref:uncharacterized protein LOC113556825 n=1 Tax=Rhopalosiphum maidis TaxID=43146 RepID=UPI000EFDB2F7|nr:uncharacterized protein LOC113556825 [Rhopalosiphum maidis]XP_026817789.1 uncharacterized protein LOC113556825 [Rhopalosiphum maidis]XP_026817790.1 uncharacterized protein LOC113556825 [Rhopalosiphum maidis]XP_026817791.1 uncharacterized protein LOC113556825 [Rhopalosiphum maidis]